MNAKTKLLLFTLFAFALTVFLGMSEAAVALQGYADKNPGSNKDVTEDLAQNDTTYEYVLFGRFPQSSLGTSSPGWGVESRDWVKAPNVKNGNAETYYAIEPILWRVLSADQSGSGRRAVLLSERLLYAHVFDERERNDTEIWGQPGSTWSNYNLNYGYSQVRTSLVGDEQYPSSPYTQGIFGNAGVEPGAYFTGPEQGAVDSASLTTSDGGNKSVATGNPLFLLSWSEVGTASGDPRWLRTSINRRGYTTAYAASRADDIEPGDRAPWNTRSVLEGRLIRVLKSGSTSASGVATDQQVRPACFLNLESFIFKSASTFPPSFVNDAGSRLNPYKLYT